MSDALRSRVVHAVSWTLAEAIVQRGVQFVISIVLARLLFPEQFGLIGMLTIVMAVIRAFLDSGFGSALIQKREATAVEVCSVFYFNVAVGVLAAGLLCVGAPWIAAFYQQPLLTPLARALSLTVVINSFGMIQRTVLTKQISFKAQTVSSLLAGVFSGGVGIALALGGFGVWSLVVQQIVASFAGTVSLWIFSPWRPALIFSATALASLFGFGSRVLLSGVLNQIFDNIYLVVIGKLYSPADLGFFARAKGLNDMPSQTLSGVVGRVTFPVFSTIQDDPVRLKGALRKALTFVGVVNFPVMIGLAVIAYPLVVLLLTERWTPCVPYLQLLCIGGLLYPLHLMNLNVLQALGRSDLFFNLEVVKKLLIVVSIAVTWRYGISALIAGMVAVSVISYYLNTHYNALLVDYPMSEQVADLLPYLFASVAMGTAVHLAGLIPVAGALPRLAVQVPVGAVCYTLLCWFLKLDAFLELWETICGLRSSPALRAVRIPRT